jgi:hypothetical protein
MLCPARETPGLELNLAVRTTSDLAAVLVALTARVIVAWGLVKLSTTGGEVDRAVAPLATNSANT